MMYEVQAKCGHVGRNMYTLKTFAVEASSGSVAARRVRGIPRVKHQHKDAIRLVKPIDMRRFQEIRMRNQADPYFRCHSVQEQRMFCPELTVLEERPEEVFWRTELTQKQKEYYDGKRRIRNIKKYMRHNRLFQEDDIA